MDLFKEANDKILKPLGAVKKYEGAEATLYLVVVDDLSRLKTKARKNAQLRRDAVELLHYAYSR